MTNGTCALRRSRRAWLRTARTAAAITAMAALALLLAACGGSSSSGNPSGSSSAGGSTNSQALAYSRCMRAHGIHNFPDPDSHGVLPKVGPSQLGVSQSKFQAADSACAHLLQPTQAQTRQLMSGLRNFAHCMRNHGVQNWPDPTTDTNGDPVFDIPGIDPNSPQVNTASNACLHLVPPSPQGHTTVELCDGVGEGGQCHGYGNPNS